MSVRFGVSDAIAFSWARYKEQPGKLIGAMFVSGLAFLVPYIIGAVLMDGELSWLGFIFMLVAIVIAIITGIGLLSIGLKIVDRKPWDFGELFGHMNVALRYVGASILYGLITVGGMFLFVLPGLYWSTRFAWFPFFVIDKNQGAVESLKSSWALTQGSFWDLFSANIGYVLLMYVSMLPFGLGLFITMPMYYVFQAYVFRNLEKNPFTPVA